MIKIFCCNYCKENILRVLTVLWLLFSIPASIYAGFPDKKSINKNNYTESKVCGECHKDIYYYWKNSLHAMSLENPIFNTAYMQSLRQDSKKAKELCLRCHAPAVLFNSDYELKQDVTREGISCDFCHTIAGIILKDTKYLFSIKVGETKRGPLKNASSPVHNVEYSSLHTRSEFCAGCHELRGNNNVPIMETYTEWQKSPYAAQGKQCQDCHMPEVEGFVVDPKLKESSRTINLHDIQGGHSLTQLKKSVQLNMVNMKKEKDTLNVGLKIANIGSGHMIPTGIPSQQLVLEVSLIVKNKIIDTQTREYEKVISDASGRVLKDDWDIIMNGAKILNDNRLAPLEERIEHFTFQIPQGYEGTISSKIYYVYRPYLMEKQEIKVEINSSENTTK